MPIPEELFSLKVEVKKVTENLQSVLTETQYTFQVEKLLRPNTIFLMKEIYSQYLGSVSRKESLQTIKENFFESFEDGRPNRRKKV